MTLDESDKHDVEIYDLGETIAQLKLKNTRLCDALQLLQDNQNGCPLPKYEIDWNEAMRLSYELLGETK